MVSTPAWSSLFVARPYKRLAQLVGPFGDSAVGKSWHNLLAFGEAQGLEFSKVAAAI